MPKLPDTKASMKKRAKAHGVDFPPDERPWHLVDMLLDRMDEMKDEFRDQMREMRERNDGRD